MFGWLYRYSITAVLLFCLILLAPRHGALRLGSEDDQPSIARMNWYAMMFGAGMGIGLLFWTVPEPLSWLLGATACLALVTFFVTSSTSGAFVIDVLTAGGDPDPSRIQRLFWSIMIGLVAGGLLLGGGLVALQTAAIIAGLPFSVVLLLCISIWRAVELEGTTRDPRPAPTDA